MTARSAVTDGELHQIQCCDGHLVALHIQRHQGPERVTIFCSLLRPQRSRRGGTVLRLFPSVGAGEGDLQTRRFSAVRRRVPHTAKYLLSRAKIRFP